MGCLSELYILFHFIIIGIHVHHRNSLQSQTTDSEIQELNSWAFKLLYFGFSLHGFSDCHYCCCFWMFSHFMDDRLMWSFMLLNLFDGFFCLDRPNFCMGISSPRKN